MREIVGQNGCVLATDKDTDKAKSLCQALPSEQIQFMSLDIIDSDSSDSIDQAIASGVKQFDAVDASVNAAYPRKASWGSPGGILDQQPESFLEIYRNSCTSKGMLDPTDVAGTVLFLLSDQSKYINGQNIVIDDGWSL